MKFQFRWHLLVMVFYYCLEANAVVTSTLLKNVPTSSPAYKLLRLTGDKGLETYALWIEPKASVGSVVVITEPYTGIDWTGLDLDQKVAALPEAKTLGLIEDTYGPWYTKGKSQKIIYEFKSPEDVIAQAIPYTINGIGALFVFPRFYAGKSIADSAEEVALSLEFLGTQSVVDPKKIGIYGASWGGFEAVHGAARAKPAVKPSIGVAWQPMLNFSRFWDDYTLNYFLRFQNNPSSQKLVFQKLEPYARRVALSTFEQGNGKYNFSSFGMDFLKANLNTPFLILHDDWDTLVPVEHTNDLLAAMPLGKVETFIVPRSRPIDYTTFDFSHFPVATNPNFDTWGSFVFAYAYLINHLAPKDASYWISLYEANQLWALLAHMKVMKSQGKSLAPFTARLIDLCHPKIWLYDVSGLVKETMQGQVLLSFWINFHFGLKTEPETVRSYLENKGL